MHILKNIVIIILSVVVLLLLTRLCWSYFGTRSIEKPKVLSSSLLSWNIQIFTVAPMIQAIVKVTWSQDQAISNWFRQLAAYIFWDNTTSESIAMTAPVALTQKESTTIAMTAPVSATQIWESYSVSFMMPSNFTLDSLPKPTNHEIVFEELPSKTYYVWRFWGFSNESRAKKQFALFLDELKRNDITPSHHPILNQYNDPRTIWFMRRNERWIEK